MQKHRINHFLLLGVFLLSSIWSNAKIFNVIDGYSVIPIQEKKVESFPRGSSIQASIDGHVLSVVFTENLGHVQIEVTTSTGGTVDLMDIYTPNGYNAYISYTGDYVVTFTLSNGDEYYGEFTVTD